MLVRLLPLGALLLLPAALRFSTLPGAPNAPATIGAPLAPDRALASIFPERTLMLVEAPGLAPLLERGLDDPFVARVLAGEVDQLLRARTGSSAKELLARADAAAGQPLLPALAALASRGAAFGLGFAGDHVTWTLALHGDDPAEVRALLDAAFKRLAQRFGVAGAFDEPHLRLAGADAWRVGDELVVAVQGSLLALGNDEATLTDVLKLAADPGAAGLTARKSYGEAQLPGKAAPLLSAFVDLERLELLASLGGDTGMAELRAWPRMPAVQLLFGPAVAALGTARALGVRLDLSGERLDLAVAAAGVAPPGPLETDGAHPLPPAPRPHAGDVSRALVYRDLAGAFAHRAELFPPDAIAAFGKAEGDLALFFGGADLVKDVLAHISPWMRVVVRRAEFEAGSAPENPLPAAALVVALDDPETLGPRLTSAFQTLISILNVERAQQGHTAFLLGLESIGKCTLTTARLPRPGPEDGVDISYNLAPACAWVGGAFIVSTHFDLARELAAELQGEAASSSEAKVEGLHLAGPAAARFVLENEETLALRNSLEKGQTLEAARADIDTLRALLTALGDVEVEVRRPSAERVEVAVSLRKAEAGR